MTERDARTGFPLSPPAGADPIPSGARPSETEPGSAGRPGPAAGGPAGRSSGRLRILLISPRGPLYRHRTGIMKKSLRYAPLTLTTLAALVPAELDAEVVLVDEGIEAIDASLRADLVGISCITGTAPRAYQLADDFRRRGIPVVLGGVHPTLLPDEAQQHADSVVVGYAEESWPELLRDFAAGRMKARYLQRPGLSLKHLTPPRREMLDRGNYTMFHTIEATRGCIHKCDFCVVPTAWGGPYQRPVAQVVDEIRGMGSRRLIFLDLDLISDVQHAKELFSALVPLGITWGGLATISIASDDELLELAARSGCRGLLLGFESMCHDSLLESRKGFNTRKDYHEVVRKLHAHGIAIMGCFALGFDHDSQDVFAETLDFVLSSGIDLPRYAILTPFPATPLFRRLKSEGRILTENWELYDAQHVVFQPSQMTPEQLLRGAEWTWRQTYSYPSIARRLLKARTQLSVALPANLGYRFYAYNLSRFYTCREPLL